VLREYYYSGVVVDAPDPVTRCVRLDLGFRVTVPYTFTLLRPSDDYPVGASVSAYIYPDTEDQLAGELLPASDREAAAGRYRYPATLIRVVDGDTIDARVFLGFSICIDERFRLLDVSAREIFGVDRDTPGYRKGLAAKRWLEERFAESGGAMMIWSHRRGKWRRWLAQVFLPTLTGCMNYRMIQAGVASYTGQSTGRRDPAPPRLTINLEPDLHTRLAERARTMDLTPATLAHTAITEYLEE
jgi:micrococcal nuclease